jgi:hypothetical protein
VRIDMLSAPPDIDSILNLYKSQFEKYSPQQLLQEAGTLKIPWHPGISSAALQQAGLELAKEVAGVVCRNPTYSDLKNPTLEQLLAAVLAALGGPAASAVIVAALALTFYIMDTGLDAYCQANGIAPSDA